MAGSSWLQGHALGIAACILGANPGPRVCQLEGRALQLRQSGGYCKEILGQIFVRPGTFRAQQDIYLMFTLVFSGLKHFYISWLTNDKASTLPLLPYLFLGSHVEFKVFWTILWKSRLGPVAQE